jgi:acyl carrier protein
MNIKETVRTYLVDELISGARNEDITNDTALLGSGLIDSISTLQLVDFLEKEFGIEFQAHEVDRDNLDTLLAIEAFVKSKL